MDGQLRGGVGGRVGAGMRPWAWWLSLVLGPLAASAAAQPASRLGCTLNGIIYQVGQRTTVTLRASSVSGWIGRHPQWQFVSSTPTRRGRTRVTVECQP
jgi:hypothetical protein